ncbi:MAG: thioredoxin family protein [Acidobacteria bacterium]|nr:thioredoxin family protein [Acidobacteriota bacterium]
MNNRLRLSLAAPVAVLALWATSLAAQPAMSGFLPIDKFVFFVDGVEDSAAEVYQSQAAGAYLVISSVIDSPILVQARTAVVSTVNLMKVDRQADGTVNLLPDATLESLGRFTIEGEGISFSVGSRAAELRNKPWLLGTQDLDGMRAYSREYREGASASEYSQPVVRQLLAESRPVEVKVFFGSWCPTCQQVLPRVLRVAQELAGSKIELSFYGLPRGPGFKADPEVKRFDIESVPIGVILVEGREVGRISGSGWKIPELAIKKVIQGS